MRSLAESECEEITTSLSEKLKTTFPKLLIPPSSSAEFSALIEIKAGVGGDEAALFVSEVLRMYTRIAASNRFAAELVSQTALEGSKGSSGGIRDAILEVNGKGAYDVFRWESGVHRIQRVPATETQGRVHTSTIAVVVYSVLALLSFLADLSLRSSLVRSPLRTREKTILLIQKMCALK